MQEEDLTLGPFYDGDGIEILPCATEATDKAIEECMGAYRLFSNVPTLGGRTIAVTPRIVTEHIQAEWDRMCEDKPDEGFLLAYLSSQKAVGRLAEDIVCAVLFKQDVLSEPVAEMIPVGKAIERRLLSVHRGGIRCDDLFLVTDSGRKYLGEVKASFVGRSYLFRSLPKAVGQLRSTLAANPDVEGAVLTLTSIREKFIVLIVASHAEIGSHPPSHWQEVCRALVAQESGVGTVVRGNRVLSD